MPLLPFLDADPRTRRDRTLLPLTSTLPCPSTKTLASDLRDPRRPGAGARHRGGHDARLHDEHLRPTALRSRSETTSTAAPATRRGRRWRPTWPRWEELAASRSPVARGLQRAARPPRAGGPRRGQRSLRRDLAPLLPRVRAPWHPLQLVDTTDLQQVAALTEARYVYLESRAPAAARRHRGRRGARPRSGRCASSTTPSRRPTRSNRSASARTSPALPDGAPGRPFDVVGGASSPATPRSGRSWPSTRTRSRNA